MPGRRKAWLSEVSGTGARGAGECGRVLESNPNGSDVKTLERDAVAARRRARGGSGFAGFEDRGDGETTTEKVKGDIEANAF